LGQIISTIFGTVIISVDIAENRKSISFNGLYPREETIKLSVKDIDELISNNTFDVVFIINPSGRHYNSFIPIIDSSIRDIKRLNIMAYNRIKENIVWQ
jgi:hypothetical protein